MDHTGGYMDHTGCHQLVILTIYPHQLAVRGGQRQEVHSGAPRRRARGRQHDVGLALLVTWTIYLR
jgi:hypothetical protein